MTKATPELEAMARAIYAALGHEEDDRWDAAIARRAALGMDDPYSANQDTALRVARAALLAIREPSEGMRDAATSDLAPSVAFTTMIDHILGEF